MTIVWGLGGLAGIYVVVVALLWAFQEKLTFPAPRAALPDPHEVLGYGERIELTMRDGTRLAGWYLAAEGGEGRRRAAGSHPGLLWFYGNGETIGAIWPIIRDFRPRNASLLVVDYPGYGASEGKASEAGMYEAADLAYDEIARRPDVDPRRIYVYGRSLGTAAATHLAATKPIAGLILESPYTSAKGMAARHYRIVPTALVRLRLDNIGRMPSIRCPVL
ncbi:MAG: alpha/beta hydrolase, partial [Gemmatimonadales bacterium]